MKMTGKNPPRTGQFKKGQSGNKKGRPKQAAQSISASYLSIGVGLGPLIGIQKGPL